MDTAKPPCPQTLALGVVILAAGASRRMGRPKLLLPWGQTSVIGHLIQQWTTLGARQIAVVHAVVGEPLAAELDRLSFPRSDRIANPAPERGMFSSLQCAALWTGWQAGLSHWLIALGDQPQVRLETLRSLLEAGVAHPERICQPSYAGRPKHPALLPKAVFLELGRSSAANLKEFLQLRAAELYWIEFADAGLAVDLDTPADYEKALKLDTTTHE